MSCVIACCWSFLCLACCSFQLFVCLLSCFLFVSVSVSASVSVSVSVSVSLCRAKRCICILVSCEEVSISVSVSLSCVVSRGHTNLLQTSWHLSRQEVTQTSLTVSVSVSVTSCRPLHISLCLVPILGAHVCVLVRRPSKP